MGRGRQIFAAALLASLLAHLALLATVGDWWALPRDEVPFPLEARLELPHAPPVAALEQAAPAAPPSRPASSEPKPVEPVPPPPVPPLPAPPPLAPVPEMPRIPAAPAPALPPPPPQTVAVQEPEPSAPASTPDTRRVVRTLPERLVLVYDVLSGEGGFNLGQATYTWQAREGRYRLESVAQAAGLVSLFMSGRIQQTSEGRVGPAGLVPERFWQSRSERRQDAAHFDWERGVLVLPQGEEPLREGSQDLLSFPFHLAMTVTEGDAGWIVPVTNGRRLKGYRFQVLGRERLEAGGDSLETIHVQGTRAGDGSLDVWLAPARHWLPVRIRTQDLKGKVMELTLARAEG